MRACRLCNHELGSSEARCKSCGAWNVNAGEKAKDDDGSILFEEISSAERTRIRTGLLDDCLGGGCILSDVILMGGPPGCGKSTAMLQIASGFCAHGSVLYIAGEEDVKTIKARGERLKIQTHGRLRMLPALSGVANIGELLMVRKPNFIILDSIDALSGKNDEVEIQILNALKKFCVELQSPALVISQINKAGDYAGLMAKQHAVDVLLTFSVSEFDGATEPLRVLETLKNRSGRAYVKSYFEMTSDGLVLTLDPTAEKAVGVPEESGVSEEDSPVSEGYDS